MKFFIEKGNIGNDATKEQALELIEMLKKLGWDVEYGRGKNKATDISEFGQEGNVSDSFSNAFMDCIAKLGI
ncbi:MAG: hypothetical protein JRF60_04620 [Deltaproteobacteria bacterium]|nr:hypothetical protein [Deltaproteobacteria bacterium]